MGGGSYAASVDFKGTTIDGKEFVFSEYLAGKKGAVVVFFTTWCHFCQKEITGVIKKQHLFEENNLGLVLINEGESKEKVTTYLSGRNFHFPVVLDTTSRIGREAGIKGVPSFFYFDRKGEVLKFSFSLHPKFLELYNSK